MHKDLIPRVYKGLPRRKDKKTTRLKNGRRTRVDIPPEKIRRWPENTWEDARHRSSFGKFKSRPRVPWRCRRDSPNDRSGSERGRVAETSAPSRAAGGNGAGRGRQGARFGGSPRTWPESCRGTQQFRSWAYVPRRCRQGLWQILACSVHCSVYSRQWVGTSQVSINGRLDKQNMVCTHTGIPFAFKKGGNSETSYHVDEPRRPCAGCRRTDAV